MPLFAWKTAVKTGPVVRKGVSIMHILDNGKRISPTWHLYEEVVMDVFGPKIYNLLTDEPQEILMEIKLKPPKEEL